MHLIITEFDHPYKNINYKGVFHPELTPCN